jgi:hypothetical protein
MDPALPSIFRSASAGIPTSVVQLQLQLQLRELCSKETFTLQALFNHFKSTRVPNNFQLDNPSAQAKLISRCLKSFSRALMLHAISEDELRNMVHRKTMENWHHIWRWVSFFNKEVLDQEASTIEAVDLQFEALEAINVMLYALSLSRHAATDIDRELQSKLLQTPGLATLIIERWTSSVKNCDDYLFGVTD